MKPEGKPRGRPVTFDDAMRRDLAALVRRHGATGARAVSPVPVTVKTLLKIAHEHGVTLRKGRRRAERSD
jgi:hypothetical protein